LFRFLSSYLAARKVPRRTAFFVFCRVFIAETVCGAFSVKFFIIKLLSERLSVLIIVEIFENQRAKCLQNRQNLKSQNFEFLNSKKK